MYAVAVSKRDGSMLLPVIHAGSPGMLGVTLLQRAPASWLTCSRPSLVPAQIKPGCTRDSAIAKTTPAYSTPLLSGGGPPEIFWRLLSFRVRSGEISRQLVPPSVV